ncbi:hypothetical protein [Adhaeribacter aquaticus]|uniref:hypothetical protein n=1 Tax=Adhaeribacter aquaticus TaxID=299567 RepID=UPI00047E8A39|nr:hypothetical protein [Adhaeribacter aquaticus]
MSGIMQAKVPFSVSKVLRSWVLVAFWIFISVSAFGQAQNATLEKAKLDIWQEAASFVYRDAEMPEPESISMANNMDEFVKAIQKEDAKTHIFSKVYKPIEETGTYRKGKDLKSQLDLLVKSINSKLRENTQRMQDFNRRQKLNDLIKQLQEISSDYTAPTPSPTAVAPTGLIDSAGGNIGTSVNTRNPGDTTEEEYAENQLSSIAKRNNKTSNNNWMSNAAIFLALISLGLIYFLYKAITNLNKRMDQRKKDVDSLELQIRNLGKAKTGDFSSGLTKAEIESLIQQTVARELAKIQVAEPVAAPKPNRERFDLEKASPAPVAKPELEVAAPAPAEAPVTPPPAPQPEKPQSYFARVPVNGGFHEQDLNPTQQHDSIYEIRISKKDPTKAAFRIVTSPNVHRAAIESAYLSLKDACNYQLNNPQASRIVTDEPGLLSNINGFWKIDRKAQVHFE